jgi:hypothetical protein
VWRRLVITYPDSIVADARQQTYCFDQHGLIRRLDYTVGVLGGTAAVDHPSDYRASMGSWCRPGAASTPPTPTGPLPGTRRP